MGRVRLSQSICTWNQGAGFDEAIEIPTGAVVGGHALGRASHPRNLFLPRPRRFNYRPSAGSRAFTPASAGGKNFSITAGGDLGLPVWHRLRPTIEIRGTYPSLTADTGIAAQKDRPAGGLQVNFLLGHRIHPYGDFLFGRVARWITGSTTIPSAPRSGERGEHNLGLLARRRVRLRSH